MDYRCHLVPSNQRFLLSEGHSLNVTGANQHITISRIVSDPITIAHWQTSRVGYETVVSQELQGSEVFNLPPNEHYWLSSDSARGYTFTAIESTRNKTINPPLPSYEVYGVTTLYGDKEWCTAPIDSCDFTRGHLDLTIEEAWISDSGFGYFTIETSPDGDEWFQMPNGGLSEGALRIEQQKITTGKHFGDAIAFGQRDRFLRVWYQPSEIVGRGFRAQISIQLQRKRS